MYAKGRDQTWAKVASPQGGAASPLAARALREAALAHLWSRPFAYIIIPENLSQGGAQS